jgi:hypothetical protein
MSARSGVAISILLLSAAACGTSQPVPSPTLGRAATAPPTAPASSRPTLVPRPTRAVGVFPNADGSTFVGTPTLLNLAQPGDGAIWGSLRDPGVGTDVVRIDPDTLEFEVFLQGLPILPNPVGGVAANGSFWLGSYDRSSFTQYDIETGKVVREIKVGRNPVEPVVAYGDLWTPNHNGDSVTRIDVETGDARSISLPGARPLQITAVADDLMLVNGPSPTTFVVDPQRMKLVGTYEPSGCYEAPGWTASAFQGQLWRKRCGVDEVAILDPRTGKVLESFDAPIHASLAPLVVDGIWWFPTAADNVAGNFALAGLDPGTREIVGSWKYPASISEGWAFAAFDSWWRWGDEGILRVPADTLRASMR